MCGATISTHLGSVSIGGSMRQPASHNPVTPTQRRQRLLTCGTPGGRRGKREAMLMGWLNPSVGRQMRGGSGTHHTISPPATNSTTSEVIDKRESPVTNATVAISMGPRKLANLPIML